MNFNLFRFKMPKLSPKFLTAGTAFGLALALALISPKLANINDLSSWARQLGNAVWINTPLNSDSPLGTNLNGIADWSTEMPFVDAFKSSRKWITQCASGEPGCSGSWDTNEYDKLDLDEQGWVKSLPAPEAPPEYTRVRTILLDNERYPGGQYVVLYDGEGTIEYNFDAQKNQDASTPGRDVIYVTPSPPGIHLIITSTDPNKTGNYIRNIRVVPAASEKNYQSEIFSPDFTDKIKKFRALRFMDWMETNNSEQSEWAKRPKVEKASYAYGGGVPVELMVELANRMEADPWFNMPHMATDEYMTEFAQLVKNTFKSNIKVYVEFSNEVWNWQFKQAHYALQQGKDRWGQDKADAYMQWYGMRTAQMCDIWKSAFGNQKNRVLCVMGTQTAWKGLENYPLECSYWVAEGNKPCYQHGIDAYAITGYFSGGLGAPENSSTVESWLNDPDGGFGKAFQQLKEGGLLAGYKDSLPDTYNNFNYHLKVAEEKGLKLVAYEGGQHITGSQGVENNEKLTKLFIELNRRPEMYGIYTQLLNDWKTSGGTLFMHFSDIGQPSKWGSWGALEYVQQNGSPKYNALLDFIDKNPCWWDGCPRAELIPYHKIARNFALRK
jgi:hypothetical protein